MTMREDFNQFIPNEGIHLGSPTRLGLAYDTPAYIGGDLGMQTELFNRLSNISPVTPQDIQTLDREGFLYPRDLMTGMRQHGIHNPFGRYLGEMIQERMAWEDPRGWGPRPVDELLRMPNISSTPPPIPWMPWNRFNKIHEDIDMRTTPNYPHPSNNFWNII